MALTPEQIAEIEAQKTTQNSTCRPCVPALEKMMYTPMKALDHGFVRVIDYMGDDNAIVQAARVSYGKGTKKVNEDQGLINYLMRHRHTTPFEMCEIKYHIKLPIFIARQWIRHRTANVNEYSGRYSIMSNEYYIPEPENLAAQSTTNRQGRGEVLSPEQSIRVLELLKKDAEQVYGHYEEMLNQDEAGVPVDPSKDCLARELARMNLTLNYYTEWYWKIDLHNLLHFVSLRGDSHAQYEIQVYADLLLESIAAWVPHTFEAFKRYRMEGMHLSREQVNVVRKVLMGQPLEFEGSGMSPREWREFTEGLNLPADIGTTIKKSA